MCLCPGWSPLKINTARDGVMVRALTAEMNVETAMVTANWRKNWPVMPPRKQQGTNTAASTSVMASTGPVISSIALMVAVRASSPVAICRSMFSSTTMASSTTMPMASTRPNSVRLLSVKPIADMTAKVPISDTGTSIIGRIMARQSWRKSRTTMATRMIGIAQSDEDLVHRLANERRGVVNDLVLEAVGEARLQILHLVVNALGRLQRVGAGRLVDGQRDRGSPIERTGLIVLLCLALHPFLFVFVLVLLVFLVVVLFVFPIPVLTILPLLGADVRESDHGGRWDAGGGTAADAAGRAGPGGRARRARRGPPLMMMSPNSSGSRAGPAYSPSTGIAGRSGRAAGRSCPRQPGCSARRRPPPRPWR